MRRILRLLLMLVLLPGMLAARAETAPYAEDAVISVRNMSRTQQALADYLYPHLMQGEGKIALPDGTRYDDAAAVMNALMQDRPELFHLHTQYRLTYAVNAPEIALFVTPQYRMEAEEAAHIRQQLYAEARTLLAQCRTAEALHDALLERCTYRNTEVLDHTAVGALLTGIANCEGYAQALTLLYRMAGIPCGVIIGDAADHTGSVQRHAWNIADLNGFALIDAAWNDQDAAGFNTHWYYGLSTEQMARDHAPDADQRIPLCPGQANWHNLRGLQAGTRQEVYAAIRTLVHQGGVMNLRFTDEMLYRTVAGDLYGFLGEYNEAAAPQDAFYGGYSGMSNDAQMCLLLVKTE